MGALFLTVKSLSFLKSITILTDPSFFGTKNTGAAHGDLLGLICPFFSKSSNVFLKTS
jgi:hypothetical protein